MMSHCVYYYKITKVCVVVDQINRHWKQTDFCGVEYRELVQDSSHISQTVEFFDYDIQVEVKYAKDPLIVYKGLTGGKLNLDGNPSKQFRAGLIFIIVSCLIMGLSICKVFKAFFIQKGDGVLSKLMAKLKGQYELEEEVLEEYYPELQQSADHVAVDEND